MIGKPEELWEFFKSLFMPNKPVISNFNVIGEGNTLTHDTNSVSKNFKKIFFKLSGVSSY